MNEIHERSIRESDFATVLCDDLVLEGKLHCTQPVLINCRFEGSLFGEDKVVIYRGATFKGVIHARSIRVGGQVEGDLHANELVELESTGGVYGNITAPSIVMENGSVFEGQSHILRNHKKNSPPPPLKSAGAAEPPPSSSEPKFETSVPLSEETVQNQEESVVAEPQETVGTAVQKKQDAAGRRS